MAQALLKWLVPIPRIPGHRNAVFVGSHPDDIEIGAGGTAAMLAASGARVTFIICTDGGCGSMHGGCDVPALIATREREARAAAAVLGVNDVRFLGFPDAGRYAVRDLAEKLAAVFVEIAPDLVFTPDPRLPSEIHPDHIACGEATRTALVLSAFPVILERYGIPFDPAVPIEPRRTLAHYYSHRTNRTVGLSKAEYDLKLAAVACHASQFPAGATDERGMLEKYLRLRGRRFGRRVLKPYGEGFFVLGPVHQHAFPEVMDF